MFDSLEWMAEHAADWHQTPQRCFHSASDQQMGQWSLRMTSQIYLYFLKSRDVKFKDSANTATLCFGYIRKNDGL